MDRKTTDGEDDAGMEKRTERRKTEPVKWQNDDRTDMDGPNRDERTSDDGRTRRQRQREVTEMEIEPVDRVEQRHKEMEPTDRTGERQMTTETSGQ